jgi:glycosyltransferase involved in cell wall biosynthesis
VSLFGDRLAWRREPMRPKPELRAFDRVLTCSREMAAVLGERDGVDVYHASSHPHNADAIARAAADATPRAPGAPARFVSTAYGPGRLSLGRVLGRLARTAAWVRDERGRLSARQLRGALVRAHRKTPAWLAALERALAADPRAAVDFRYGPQAASLSEADYLARLAGADVYVCTSFMEGGPLPVMEAVLAGLAVITTPVGQTAEWVEDGASGFVVRTYAELERAARRYLDEPDLLAAHRARARAIAAGKRFDGAGWAAFLRGGPRR